jgi:hypothetical protein
MSTGSGGTEVTVRGLVFDRAGGMFGVLEIGFLSTETGSTEG